jgi:hypothetical protein
MCGGRFLLNPLARTTLRKSVSMRINMFPNETIIVVLAVIWRVKLFFSLNEYLFVKQLFMSC